MNPQMLRILLSCLSEESVLPLFEVTEALAFVNSLHRTWKYFQEDTNSQSDMKYAKICYILWWLKICIEQRGLVEQIYKACENTGICENLKPMVIHSIIHQ